MGQGQENLTPSVYREPKKKAVIFKMLSATLLLRERPFGSPPSSRDAGKYWLG